MLYLGIDQHRKQLTVNLRNEIGDVVLRRQVSTKWESVRPFFAELQQRAAVEGGYLAILEVCGFNDWLLKLLAEFGCRETVVTQPDTRSKRKTDRRDANALSELLWVNRHRLLVGQQVRQMRRIQPPTPADAEARQLTALRRQLGGQRTRTRNRIQHLLLKHNLQQHCPTVGLHTKAARKWLVELTLPAVDRLELNGLLVQWDLWNQQIAEVETLLRGRQAAHPVAAIVATLPGLRAGYSSLAIGSRIGDIARFKRPESLANFWGLAPGCRDSGEAHRPGSITKQGSACVRFLLGQAVMHMLRADKALRHWYREIRNRRGAKIARVAVMRKLATLIWHMVKHQEAYDPSGITRRTRQHFQRGAG